MSCGCNKVNPETPTVISVVGSSSLFRCTGCGDGLPLDDLKSKVSCEFLTLLSMVERGHYPDYEFILEEISLIDTYNELDKKNFILQYYLNNPWETS